MVTAVFPSAPDSDLKHLAFVRDGAGYVSSKTFELYATGKGLIVPESLKPQVKTYEDKASSFSSPYVSKLADSSNKTLSALDSSVDSLVTKAHGYYTSSQKELKTRVDKTKSYHEESLESYRSARESYLKKVEEAVDFLKKEGITGTAKYALDAVSARLAEAKKLPAYFDKEAKVVLGKVSEAWNKLVEHPTVKKAVDTAQPHVDYAYKQYLSAHHTVAASPYYHKAYSTGSDYLSQVQSTDLYKGAYSRISPYADPAVKQITSSPYYQATLDHLKPLPTNGKKVAT